MKKILSNPYFDKVLSSLIAIGVALAVYFLIDVRDFIKYKQPYRDEMQDNRIQQLQEMMVNKCNYMDSVYCEKVRNIHKRIDNVKDMLFINKNNNINTYEKQ